MGRLLIEGEDLVKIGATILRWIAVLPGAVLAAATAYLISRAIIRAGIGQFLVAPSDWWPVRSLVDGGSHVALGAAAVCAGFAIMPRRTLGAIVGISAAITIPAALLFVFALLTSQWWGVYASSGVVVGAIGMTRLCVDSLASESREHTSAREINHASQR